MLLVLVVVGWVYPLFLLLGRVPLLIRRLTTLAFAIHILFTQQILIAVSHNNSYNNLTALDGLVVINSTLLTSELFIVIIALIVVVSLIGVGHSSYSIGVGHSSNSINSYDYLWLLANVIGIGYLLASKDWLLTIAAGEVFNLSLYLLAGVIGLQYFLLSALATTLLILGVAIIYALAGTTHYEGLIIVIAYVNSTITGESLPLTAAINLLIVAMLLKLGVAPIHNWAIDLYSILALSLTFWFALLPKLAIFGVLLQIPITIKTLLVINACPWATVNVMMSTAILAGFVVGSIGLMGQWQIGRFMAYSAIVHFGYFLLAFIANARTSYIFYASIYGITVLNLFILLYVMQCRLTVKQPSNLFLIRLFALNRNRLLLPFAVSLFSLAAIPPFAGFYAKLTVLAEGIHWIAIFAVLASTLSAANYLSLGCNVIGFQQYNPYQKLGLDSLKLKVPQCNWVASPVINSRSYVVFISSPTITLILATFYLTLLTPLTLLLSI